ncbi:MAG: hypothetical protein J07HB67_02826 [halophilic archaeon J07HB67]|jgi:hypothetical protein|nr:MAG: hypothetical protein J07HB67_02826 [halophilic archaeon J07HB67]
MRGKDAALSIVSNPKATRVLLLLGVVALFSLAADPAAAHPCDPFPPYDDLVCE